MGGLLRRYAPLRKRLAFVAGNDGEVARPPTTDLLITPSNGRTTPKVKPRQPVKAAREEFHATFASRAGHCRAVRRARRAVAAADARREPPQPSVPDLG